MQIEINEKIIDCLKKRVDSSDEFESVEAYVNSIMEQVVERLNNEFKEENITPEEQVYSKEDEEKIKEKLKDLGYLD
jgi:hypothetical protein